ncbi:MAG TPA: MFS transporter [Franconibacter pulveris]|nr:MFS transporter [Franconibacter pulveris]
MSEHTRPLNRQDYKTLTLAALGGALEFYDFIIFVFFAAVVGEHFFPADIPEWLRQVQTFGIFAAGYLARPLGGIIMAHFGDLLGRKKMFTLSIFMMALPTLGMGLMPIYAQIGVAAPILLLVLRIIQGAAIGGEVPGAWVFVSEHVPGKHVGYACGTLTAGLTFGILLGSLMATLINTVFTPVEVADYAWRFPFIIGGVFGQFSVYLRRWLHETPVFAEAMARREKLRLPMVETFGKHGKAVLLGALSMVVCYALFYISTVFSLSYGVKNLGYSRQEFLGLLCIAVLFMALATPLSAWLADRFGRKPVLAVSAIAALLSGFAMEPLLTHGSSQAVGLFLALELFLMGMTFGPMGALLPEIFPTQVRYTGASAAYNLGGILGASLAPYAAQQLVEAGGLSWVGGYVSAAAAISLLAVLCMRETRDQSL